MEPKVETAVKLLPREEEERQTAQIAIQTGIPYFDSRQLTEVPDTNSLLPLEELREYKIAPLHYHPEHNQLELGLTGNTDTTKLPELQTKLGQTKLTFKTISATGLQEILNKIYYHSFDSERNGNFDIFGKKLGTSTPKAAFGMIAQLAFWLGASDIHIEPYSKQTRIRFRIDGILHPITNVATESYVIFLSDLQTKAQIKWGSDAPQSGRISLNLMDNNAKITAVNMRIETIPAFHGEEIVVRIFNNELKNLHLEGMGFSQSHIKKITDVTAHPNGMVLTVGPTGSGKTSTLYAIINRLNNPEVKIVTLEDPVEYDLPGISQIPVRSEDKELFAEKLRAVLREDPNTIMIGEIRDVDTAKTALQAALTGHLVLSTFHGASAAAAITRMVDMIRMIIAQRLARRICPHCIEPHKATTEEAEFIQRALKRLPVARRPAATKLKLKHGKGCAQCHGLGYQGRIAIIEMMPVTPDIEALMTSNRTTAADIENLAVKNGMQTLLEDGLQKAFDGITTIEEIMRLSEA
jgi:type II secretory ATPase GspE/PulE/Tfp pilus assembly ATPase PilB-like protein